jgi:hypothetical protein
MAMAVLMLGATTAVTTVAVAMFGLLFLLVGVQLDLVFVFFLTLLKGSSYGR